MTNTIKPITQTEMTETKIGYSVKIGRQVLKEKLKLEIAKINNLIAENVKNLAVNDAEAKILYAEMKQRIMIYIDNDETFHSIKLLYNILHDDEPITNIHELINTDLNDLSVLHNSIRPQSHCSHEAYKHRINNQFISISIDFFIGVYDKSYEEYNHTSYYFSVDITSSLLALMSKHEKTLHIHNQHQKDLYALENKLRNLDETMEAMEAKLLVQELDKTTEGKEVLQITQNIINETLNSQIALT